MSTTNSSIDNFIHNNSLNKLNIFDSLSSSSSFKSFTSTTLAPKNCSIINCSKDLKLICDEMTGHCKCPSNLPIRLSEEIPCLPSKYLGDLCIHTDECNKIEHSVCIATFLFSIKILNKTPSFKQWFFYNKIHNDDDMNYLLNKLYGRCRCQKGFRAISPNKCVPLLFDNTYIECNHDNDCSSLNATNCHQKHCHCSNGYYFDVIKQKCDKIINLHEQFCASSIDCYSQHESNMECKNSKCVCAKNYSFNNETGCMRQNLCLTNEPYNNDDKHLNQRQSMNNRYDKCQQKSIFSSVNLCRFMIRTLPLLIFITCIFNIYYFIRTRRSTITQNRLYRHHREIYDFRRRLNASTNTRHQLSINRSSLNRIYISDLHDTSIQSCSLLSLPDYNTIVNDLNTNTNENNNCSSNNNDQNGMHVDSIHDRLPTYEEAVCLSINNNDIRSIESNNNRSIIPHGHLNDDNDDENHSEEHEQRQQMLRDSHS